MPKKGIRGYQGARWVWPVRPFGPLCRVSLRAAEVAALWRKWAYVEVLSIETFSPVIGVVEEKDGRVTISCCAGVMVLGPDRMVEARYVKKGAVAKT